MLVFMWLSQKHAVPEELALLYDFVNTLDCRRYVERGVAHTGGDEFETRNQWRRRCGGAACCSLANALMHMIIAVR